MKPTTHALYIRLVSTDSTPIAHPELRARLVADATDLGTNLHDVAVGLLAAKLKVPFEPSGRKTTPSLDGEELNLRVSGPLWQKLSAASTGTRQHEALRIFHEHYELEMPDRSRVAA